MESANANIILICCVICHLIGCSVLSIGLLDVCSLGYSHLSTLSFLQIIIF